MSGDSIALHAASGGRSLAETKALAIRRKLENKSGVGSGSEIARLPASA